MRDQSSSWIKYGCSWTGLIKFNDDLTGSFETRYEVDKSEAKLRRRMRIRDSGVNKGRNGSSILSPSLLSWSFDSEDLLKYENADIILWTGVEWIVFAVVSCVVDVSLGASLSSGIMSGLKGWMPTASHADLTSSGVNAQR